MLPCFGFECGKFFLVRRGLLKDSSLKCLAKKECFGVCVYGIHPPQRRNMSEFDEIVAVRLVAKSVSFLGWGE